MCTIFFTENNKWVLLISVFQYVYFIHLTAPVCSQGWNICGKKGIKCFFPPSVQSHQLPLFAEVLNTYCTFTGWVGGSAALPNKERALVFATRRQAQIQDQGPDLPGSTTWRWTASQSKEGACFVAGKTMRVVRLSVTWSDWSPPVF